MTVVRNSHVVKIIEIAIWQHHTNWAVGVTTRNSLATLNNRQRVVECAAQLAQVFERHNLTELATCLSANWVTGEIPARVFSKISNAALFTEVTAQRSCMLNHHFKHITKLWCCLNWVATKRINQVAKQPWTPQTSATNDHTVATGLFNHAQRVFSFPNISVAKYRNTRDRLLKFFDRFPMCAWRIMLTCRSCMQGNC